MRRGQPRCKRGHEFTASNTIWKPNGNRECLECRRMRDRMRYLRDTRNGTQVICVCGHKHRCTASSSLIRISTQEDGHE